MPRMLDRVVDDAVAWKSETMLPNDGLVAIDQECQAELDAALKVIQDNPMPIIALDPDDFQLPACTQMMGRIKETLDNGIGFAILDALPVDRFAENESKALYWILLSMLGNTVAQKWDGLLLYDVTDTGEKSGPGKGVRGSKTNQGQTYHTDNSYNLPPNYVSLLCLETAKEGGLSGLISFYTTHNIMMNEYPEVLQRLYEPFWFERHREHAPNDNLVSRKPMFEYDGKTLGVSLGLSRINDGYKLMKEILDDETAAALGTLGKVLERPGLGKTFTFSPGQIQIVNNRKLGHRRTAFTDWDETGRKRHLARIWVRHEGKRFYMG
ncbi:MAG: TauD/TfdA family dioxygenase [Alphaproteobacteria bacterium]